MPVWDIQNPQYSGPLFTVCPARQAWGCGRRLLAHVALAFLAGTAMHSSHSTYFVHHACFSPRSNLVMHEFITGGCDRLLVMPHVMPLTLDMAAVIEAPSEPLFISTVRTRTTNIFDRGYPRLRSLPETAEIHVRHSSDPRQSLPSRGN
jgi:hypothetical protein